MSELPPATGCWVQLRVTVMWLPARSVMVRDERVAAAGDDADRAGVGAGVAVEGVGDRADATAGVGAVDGDRDRAGVGGAGHEAAGEADGAGRVGRVSGRRLAPRRDDRADGARGVGDGDGQGVGVHAGRDDRAAGVGHDDVRVEGVADRGDAGAAGVSGGDAERHVADVVAAGAQMSGEGDDRGRQHRLGLQAADGPGRGGRPGTTGSVGDRDHELVGAGRAHDNRARCRPWRRLRRARTSGT